MAHTVCVITSTRAEYGLLRPVLQKIEADKRFNLNLIVSGSHLSREHGYTLDEIAQDGFKPAALIDFLGTEVSSGADGKALADDRLLTAKRTAKALEMFTDYFENAVPRPDVVLLLGDRYEIFAAGQAAALLNIPLAHISGGDVTHGADDDWFRHCLTKMAKLHFPSCEEYRRRVIQLGEQPGTVINVGGLGDENIRTMQLLEKAQLEASIAWPLEKSYALVTFHPETQSEMPAKQQAQILLAAMQSRPNLQYLITKANADAGGTALNNELEKFCESNKNARLFSSLGSLRYLSAMKHAALVLGNSSSGVVETPSFGTPCVNIGKRQSGRINCKNVINCEMQENEILQAIDKALSKEFTQKARRAKSPYNGGNTSEKIVEALAQALKNGSFKNAKIFYDINF